MLRPILGCLILLAAAAPAGPGFTSEPKAAAQAPASREAQDEATVRAADTAFEAGGYEALAAHLPALRDVLAHAPAQFPAMERRGRTTIVRSFDPNQALMASLMAADGPRGGTAKVVYNTYPMASFLLGSYAVEHHQPEEALTALDKGLALQPDDPLLIGEKGSALTQLKRHEEALALYEPWLAKDDDLSSDLDRAVLLRKKGLALIELGRLDEAERAYRDSLVLDPDHDNAKRELAYIARLKAGGAPTALETLTSEQARTGQR